MTEDEIVETFKKADAILSQYKETVLPAAKALAKLQEGKAGRSYEVEFGCYELGGVNVVCLHGTGTDESSERDRAARFQACEFNRHWHCKLRAAGVSHIFLNWYDPA